MGERLRGMFQDPNDILPTTTTLSLSGTVCISRLSITTWMLSSAIMLLVLMRLFLSACLACSPSPSNPVSDSHYILRYPYILFLFWYYVPREKGRHADMSHFRIIKKMQYGDRCKNISVREIRWYRNLRIFRRDLLTMMTI